MYRNYSDEDVKEAIANSFSIAEAIRNLGLIPAGGNYSTIKRFISELDLDVSHFKGTAWNKDSFKPVSELRTAKGIKNNLIREHGWKCWKCNNIEWEGQPITLELDHINGNNTDNSLENLRILCPNCHSQTSTWRRAKSSFDKKEKLKVKRSCKTYKCVTCEAPCTKNSSGLCMNCYKVSSRIVDRPDKDLLKKQVEEVGYCATGRLYKVSDTTIRKWLR